MIVVALLCFLTSRVLGSTLCSATEGCKSTTISDTYIYCYGYSACEAAYMTATTYLQCDGYYACYDAYATAVDCSCDGSFGCYSSDLTVTDDLFCDGDFGCYEADLTVTDNLYCDGEYACYIADIEVHDYLYCQGDNACRYANVDFPSSYSKLYSTGYYGGYYMDLDTITDKLEYYNYVYGYGWYSLASAFIYTGEENKYYFFFYGYKSGHSTNIYCEKESTCYVYCYGYACRSTEFYCDTTATCIGYDDSIGGAVSTEWQPKQIEWDSRKDKKKVKKNRKKEKLLLVGSNKKITNSENIELKSLENDPLYQKHVALGLPQYDFEMEAEASKDREENLQRKVAKHKHVGNAKAVLTKTIHKTAHKLNKHNPTGIFIGIGIGLGIGALISTAWYCAYYQQRKD